MVRQNTLNPVKEAYELLNLFQKGNKINLKYYHVSNKFYIYSLQSKAPTPWLGLRFLKQLKVLGIKIFI